MSISLDKFISDIKVIIIIFQQHTAAFKAYCEI